MTALTVKRNIVCAERKIIFNKMFVLLIFETFFRGKKIRKSGGNYVRSTSRDFLIHPSMTFSTLCVTAVTVRSKDGKHSCSIPECWRC